MSKKGRHMHQLGLGEHTYEEGNRGAGARMERLAPGWPSCSALLVCYALPWQLTTDSPLTKYIRMFDKTLHTGSTKADSNTPLSLPHAKKILTTSSALDQAAKWQQWHHRPCQVIKVRLRGGLQPSLLGLFCNSKAFIPEHPEQQPL